MPIPRAFGFIPRLPNEGSPHQTPASLMIDTRYATLRVVERWSWERYVRLCQFLRYTPWELASLVMLSHQAVEAFKRQGRLSGRGYRAVALVLTLLEAHVMAKWTDDIIPNPFPDLNAPSGTTDGIGGGPHDRGAAPDLADVSLGGTPAAGRNAAAAMDGDAPHAVAKTKPV
jgi:hypothetical protein